MLLPSGERQGGKVGKSAIVPRLCALRDQVSLFRGGGLVLRRSSALRSPELGRSQRKEQGTGGLEDTDYKARKAQRRAKVSQIEQDTPFFVVKLGVRLRIFLSSFDWKARGPCSEDRSIPRADGLCRFVKLSN
jgi:hypothetical protein